MINMVAIGIEGPFAFWLVVSIAFMIGFAVSSSVHLVLRSRGK